MQTEVISRLVAYVDVFLPIPDSDEKSLAI